MASLKLCRYNLPHFTMPPRIPRWLLLAAFSASGAAALVYQVVWVRMFTLALGHTVAASSTVLAAFMGGLAVGAWIAGRVRTSAPGSLYIYATLEFTAVPAMYAPNEGNAVRLRALRAAAVSPPVVVTAMQKATA